MVSKITCFAIVVMSFAIDVFAQETTADSLYLYEVADKGPEPVGGIREMHRWIAENINVGVFKNDDSVDCKKVYVSFVIDKTGELINLKLVKGAGQPFDSAAIKVFENLPVEWIPGTKDGKNVRVIMTHPLSFCNTSTLPEEPKKSKKRKKK